MTPQKSSEPACRVCGCTEYAACDEGCSWVKVAKGEPPLCSACDGKPVDVIETCRRIRAMVKKHGISTETALQALIIIEALGKRVKVRVAADAANADPAWGNR